MLLSFYEQEQEHERKGASRVGMRADAVSRGTRGFKLKEISLRAASAYMRKLAEYELVERRLSTQGYAPKGPAIWQLTEKGREVARGVSIPMYGDAV